MKQDACQTMLSEGVVHSVIVRETEPSKGKPLQGGTTSIWTVILQLNTGGEVAVEASRGGPREWASLDRLNAWLRSLGVSEYFVQHKAESTK